jgi:hypothetical protein
MEKYKIYQKILQNIERSVRKEKSKTKYGKGNFTKKMHLSIVC